MREKQEQSNARQTFCYGIWRKGVKQVGQIQLKNIAWEIPGAELGYFIDESLHRRGFAHESGRAILRLTLRERAFQRIFVRILPANTASLSLAKGFGFQQEGLHRNAFRCGLGKLNDVIYLSLTGDDYRCQYRD
jgi:RimJ/RimL family protein N-acetyltransferase